LRAVRCGHLKTVGGDKGYDERDFVTGARAMGMTPHVSPHTKRPSHVDARTTRIPASR
jgi:hypothetical protein